MDESLIVANRFRIEERIGQGGMGEVFRGIDTHTEDVVAIKKLRSALITDEPDLVLRFEREGETLRQLNHPNIVKMLAMIEEDKHHYLVMEYVAGGSLEELLRQNRQLPVEQVLQIGIDLTDALARAHRLNIIHRDIKPANVLLAEDGTPRLTDFGVAYVGDRTRLTSGGSMIGTYAYLSPEACHGETPDARTDIWSLGVVFYEMLAGRRPFEALLPGALLTSILNRSVPPITDFRYDLPPALTDLIMQMLEKDRERRIASARMVGAELEAIMQQGVAVRQVAVSGTGKTIVLPETRPLQFLMPAADDDEQAQETSSAAATPAHATIVEQPVGSKGKRRRLIWLLALALAMVAAAVALFMFDVPDLVRQELAGTDAEGAALAAEETLVTAPVCLDDALRGGFGKLHQENVSVRVGLGCPLESMREGYAVEQFYERGSMYWWSQNDTIYTFLGEQVGEYRVYSAEATAALPAPAPTESPLTPVRGFGKVYFGEPVVRQFLGESQSIEHQWNTGRFQQFKDGMMLGSPAHRDLGQTIFVLYDDGTFERYQDSDTQ